MPFAQNYLYERKVVMLHLKCSLNDFESVARDNPVQVHVRIFNKGVDNPNLLYDDDWKKIQDEHPDRFRYHVTLFREEEHIDHFHHGLPDDDGPEGSTPPASSSSAAPATVRGATIGAAQGQHQATGSSKAAGPPSHPAEASARSGRRERNRAPSKLWCHLYLDEGTLAQDAFNLNKKIIGHGGNFTKDIFVDTGAKIRLRGRGSKHLENGREAPVPLMLAVAAELSERENFARAVEKAAAHLHSVERCYGKFCTNKNLPAPAGPFFWVGEFGEEARGCLIPIFGEHLSAVPIARKSRRHTWAAPPAVS